MIPGDVRLLTSKDLFIIQATLTGESLPVEKFDAMETRENISPIELSNICFLGTSVESGTAQGWLSKLSPKLTWAALPGASSRSRLKPVSTKASKNSHG